jgi:hypothetical protein
MIGKIAVLGVVSVAGLSALLWERAVPAAARGGRAVQTAAVATKAPAGMLPSRRLQCRLGRITNFDPSHEQKPSDFTYDGAHAFALFLPAIPVRTTEPPRSTLPPEPVDPRTRILADPDGIAAGAADKPFERVVDYWPDRVEMTTALGGGKVNMIILQPTAGVPGSMDLFMTRAMDAVTWDQAHLYSGRCTFDSRPD